ncbi:MAG TPA: four-carbon acid sugar kinase family protein [Bacillales bacterium]|nr:four-carbon acid sugar kinase family protein [Bacillales bacterium]
MRVTSLEGSGTKVIGVVADDITGANDIGIMFAKSSYLTHVFGYDLEGGWRPDHEKTPDVVILDTDSRLDQPDVAYDKVFQAAKDFREAGVSRFFNKTCSVFRGNIGAEFDAMLDALEEEFAVIVLGFPKNGRTTVDGVHYVHGRRLEDSEFRNDPVHPMEQSDLVGILQSQTKRKVGLVDHSVVKGGAESIRERLKELKNTLQYAIVDVTEQKDLTVIADAVQDENVICGSSALAEELPKVWGQRENLSHQRVLLPYNGKGLLCVAGSLMPQMAEQIDYMRNGQAVVLEFDTVDLAAAANPEEKIRNAVNEIIPVLNEGTDVIFHTSNSPDKVRATKDAALEKGLSNEEISRLVSGTMAEIAEKIMQQSGQNRLIVAGGDTSGAVCSRLGIKGMRVCEEIAPGLPSCISLSGQPVALVLKSGSFGRNDFLEKAFSHLKSLSV